MTSTRQDWYQARPGARRAALGSTWNRADDDASVGCSPVWGKHDLLRSLNCPTTANVSPLSSPPPQKRSRTSTPAVPVDSNDNWSHSTMRSLIYGLRELPAANAARPKHTSAAKYWDAKDRLFRQAYGDERQLSGPIPRCVVPSRRTSPKTEGPNYRLASSCMTSWQDDMLQKSFLTYRTDRKRLGKPAQRPLAFMAR